jgi:hypothetical protein
MNTTISRRQVIAGIAVTIGLLSTTAACSCSNSSGAAANSTIKASANTGVETTMDNNQPSPIFDHSNMRSVGIEIEAIEALGENTYSFGFMQGFSHPIWSCPSLGEPFSSTSQITNPEQVDPDTNPGHPNSTAATTPNMDPNGIYSGDSTGTYVLCVNAQGAPYAKYWEGYVDTESSPAHWDASSQQIVDTGAPLMPSCSLETVKGKNQTVCSK